jgi:hypothetical protein
MRRKQQTLGSIPKPSVDFPLGLVLGVTVPLLKAARQFRALALHYLQIVIRQLAPFCCTLPLNSVQLPSTRSQFMCAFLRSHFAEINRLFSASFRREEEIKARIRG